MTDKLFDDQPRSDKGPAAYSESVGLQASDSRTGGRWTPSRLSVERLGRPQELLGSNLGHHATKLRAVLGTVQGSSLRSAHARVRAWPSGLDGACAQLTGRQLRDGSPCVSSGR